MRLPSIILALLHLLPPTLSAPNPAPHGLSEARAKHKQAKDAGAPAKPPKLQCELKHNEFCGASCFQTFKLFVASMYGIDQSRAFENGEHIACHPCEPAFAYPNWICGFVEHSHNATLGELILRKTLEIDQFGCKGCGQVALYDGSDGNVGVLKFDIIKDIMWMSGKDDHTGQFGHAACRGLCAGKGMELDAIPTIGVDGYVKEPVEGLWDGKTSPKAQAVPGVDDKLDSNQIAEAMLKGGAA